MSQSPSHVSRLPEGNNDSIPPLLPMSYPLYHTEHSISEVVRGGDGQQGRRATAVRKIAELSYNTLHVNEHIYTGRPPGYLGAHKQE